MTRTVCKVSTLTSTSLAHRVQSKSWRARPKTSRVCVKPLPTPAPRRPRPGRLASSTEAVIAALKLEILKLRRELYGQRSERKARLLEQLELQLEELEATATEDELAAEQAAARTSTAVRAFERRRPGRKPFPEHLPRERVVIEAPPTCGCCGSGRIAKLGEDVTETLEVIPRQWKVIQTVREKFTCRDCERITQPPAPFHPTPRGWAGPSLLAMILFEKFGQHQPLNRQAERYAREGVELSLSTLADQVGACAVALAPLACVDRGPCAGGRAAARRRHDRAGAGQGQDRHGPALGLCPRRPPLRRRRTARGAVPLSPAIAVASIPKRHLDGWAGVLQADAYAGFGALYAADRPPRADHRGAVLGACAAQVLRARRHRRECPARQGRQRRSPRSRWRR